MKSNKKQGFTLVELISVFTVLMLIVGIAAVSIGGTFTKNKAKADQIKMNNILRGTEDYVIKNKIKLTAGIPLYFSVNGLAQDNVLTDDADKVLEEIICPASNDCELKKPYYIKAEKQQLNNQIKYTIIGFADFQAETGINKDAIVNNLGVQYSPSTLVVKEKTNPTIKFSIAKSIGSPLYNLYIKSLKFDIIKEANGESVAADVVVKTFKIMEDGSYSFILDKTLPTGTYLLSLKINTELGTELTNDSELKLVVTDGVAQPLITFVEEPANVWYKDPVSFKAWGERQVSKDRADSILMTGTTVNNGVTTNINTTYNNLQNTGNEATITINTPGIHDINLTSKITYIGSGIVGDTKSFTIKIDNVLPTVSISPSTTAWTNGSVTLTCNASDTNSGLASKTFTTKVVTTNGTHSCTAIDYAGNTRTTSYTVSNIDKTAPTIPTWIATKSNRTSYTSGTWTNLDVTWTGFNASDSGSGIDHYEYSNCSDNTWNLLGASYTYNVDLNWAFCIRAVDKVGNVSNKSTAFNVRIDKTAPTMTRFDLKKIVSGACTGALADNGWSNVNVCILPPPVYNAIEATDGGSGINRYQISTDGASWSDLPTAWDINNSMIYIQNAGEHYRYVRALDNVGYASSAVKRYFNIDRTAPTVSYGQCRTTDATLKSGVNIVVSDLAPTTTKVYYGYNYTGGYPWAANFSAGPASNNLFEIHSLTGPAYPEKVMSTSYKYIRLVVGGNSNSSYYRAGLEVIDAAGNRYSDVSPWYLYNNTSVGYCW